MPTHPIITAAAAAFLALASAPAQAALQQATVVLGDTLTSLTVNNAATSTANVAEVVYGFGGAATGIATFEAAPGAAARNFWVAQPAPNVLVLWQISTWSGLSVAPGIAQAFAGIVPRIIAGFFPPAFGNGPDDTGASLANGSVTVRWSDGAEATADLVTAPWEKGQTLRFRAEGTGVPVPEPATLGLLGLGLLGLAATRGRRE